jgi:8-oxo-dGTP pyrophosphatase MutT (NUDIX family)
LRPAPPHRHEGKYRAAMSFSDSYLGQLRKRIGSELVLMPGAMIALRRPADGRILLTRRADDGMWCLPAGAAEPGGSFAATAIGELKEEAGVTVAENDLIPFATLSEAALHTIVYPSGDETHCFAVCFLAERWRGAPRPDGEETTRAEFADPENTPSPIHRPTAHALELLNSYLRSGRFQLR